MAYDWTQDANCVGAWLFDEGSGETLNDSSSSNNDGTFASSGNPAWSAMSGTNAPAYASQQVTFTSDYIDTGVVSWNMSNFSVGGWLYITTATGTSITNYSQVDGGGRGFLLRVSSSKQNFTYCSNYTSSSATSNDNVQTDRWVHYVGVKNSTTITLYVNGTAQTTTGTPPSGSGDSNYNLTFGRWKWWSGDSFVGSMSESFIMYDDLDSTDINDIMDNGLKQSGVVAGQFMTCMKGYW